MLPPPAWIPASIVRVANLSIDEPWAEVVARAEALRKLNFTYLVVPWPAGGRRRVEAFAEKALLELSRKP